MSTDWTVDPAFEASSLSVDDWDLSHVRLQDDARFVWFILIPRVTGVTELDELTVERRAALMEEIVRAGAIVRALTDTLGRPIDKLNVGAIGNVTAQLHVHIVGRRRDDDLWPHPVWGRGTAIPYDDTERDRILAMARR